MHLPCIIQDVLGERVKAFQAWQAAVSTLHKKREQRSRMELAGRIQRMGPLIQVNKRTTSSGNKRIGPLIRVSKKTRSLIQVSRDDAG